MLTNFNKKLLNSYQTILVKLSTYDYIIMHNQKLARLA